MAGEHRVAGEHLARLPTNRLFEIAKGAFLQKDTKIERIWPRDQGGSIELDERMFFPPLGGNESSVAALGASLVTKQAGRVPQHD